MKKIFIKNDRGERLAGLFFQGSGGINRPTVVICHGFTGSKEGQGKAVEMAEYLAQNSFSVLLFDFAGCGESEGKFENISLSGHIGDLKGAVDFCLENSAGPVITMGRSFGGTTAVCHAASDSRVGGVCTWAAPVSLTDLFMGFTDEDLPENENELVTLAGSEGIIYLKRSFFTDLSRYDVIRCSSLIPPRPLLVIHGTADDVVPPGEATLIYSSAGEPRELHYVESADHQFSAHHRLVWDVTLKWLKKHFNA
ncbi:MAG: alpha/beta hydrolase [Bacillota bacterium]